MSRSESARHSDTESLPQQDGVDVPKRHLWEVVNSSKRASLGDMTLLAIAAELSMLHTGPAVHRALWIALLINTRICLNSSAG
jgi:hypothetical protein